MIITTTESRSGTHDDQIEYLESQIEGYRARTSQLQQHLLDALDSLDEVVKGHNEQLEQERAAKEQAQSRRDSGHTVNVDCIVEFLKRELRSEREAHAETCARANNLAAQVANRDAALETWAQQAPGPSLSPIDNTYVSGKGKGKAPQAASHDAAQNAPITSTNVHGMGKGKSALKRKVPDAQRDLDHAEMSILFEEINAKNRVLEQEVHSLSRHVKETRQRASVLLGTTISPPNLPSMPQQRSDGTSSYQDPISPLPNPPRDSNLPVSVISPSSLPSPLPSPPHPSRDAKQSTSTIPHAQLPPLDSRPRSHSHTPRPLASSSPHHGRSRPGSRLSQRPPTVSSEPHSRAQSRHRPPTPGPSSFACPPAETFVQRLNEQIQLLSLEIDAFRTERTALTSVIESQLHRGEDATVTPETYRRDASFDSFDADREQSFSVEAESEAGRRFEAAVASEPTANRHGYDFDTKVVAGSGAGNVTDSGERSMEMATPLFSSLVTFPESAPGEDEGDAQLEVGEGHGPGGLEAEVEEEEIGDGQIRMIRPRRRASSSPPAP
ncbi:hypothetical protein C0991_006651 [Blastosporella zonata]|nr:hypothetical protein C0991_006651 [Blastosporella zonata]